MPCGAEASCPHGALLKLHIHEHSKSSDCPFKPLHLGMVLHINRHLQHLIHCVLLIYYIAEILLFFASQNEVWRSKHKVSKSFHIRKEHRLGCEGISCHRGEESNFNMEDSLGQPLIDCDLRKDTAFAQWKGGKLLVRKTKTQRRGRVEGKVNTGREQSYKPTAPLQGTAALGGVVS